MSTHGKSILESMWEQLDAWVELLIADGEPEAEGQDGDFMSHDEFAEWGRQQGRCEGLALAIAILTNPYAPDLPGIKEQAHQRWLDSQEG